MIKKFLKAKHWQLFLLTFGIPFIFQIIVVMSMFSSISSSSEPNWELRFYYLQAFPLIMILLAGVWFGWF